MLVNKIIVNGRGGSGKDEFADYLVANYGFKKIAFADGIYEIAKEYFKMERKDRKLLQDIGEKMREIDPMIWVKYTFKKAEEYGKVVISDCRRANEYQVALENGYLPIRINADLNLRIKRLYERDGIYPDLELLENKSETGADDYEFIHIDNNGTKEELYKQIDEIMQQKWDKVLNEIQTRFILRQMY